MRNNQVGKKQQLEESSNELPGKRIRVSNKEELSLIKNLQRLRVNPVGSHKLSMLEYVWVGEPRHIPGSTQLVSHIFPLFRVPLQD